MGNATPSKDANTDELDDADRAPAVTLEPEVGSAGRWETLAQAFAAHHFPSENLPLVQKLVDRIGVSHYEGIKTGGYIKGIRQDGGRPLHIHFGYTTGIASESEILDSVGYVDCETGGGVWAITHPVNSLRSSGSRTSKPESGVPEFCQIHFIQLPASGRCYECEG